MCQRHQSCAFYCAHSKDSKNNILHHLLIETYCKGDFHEVCRRKGYEEDMGSAPLADLGPNGYSIESHRRVY